MIRSHGPHKQTQAQQRKHIYQCGKYHREDIAHDWNKKHKPHNREQDQRHCHADAQIRNQLSEHEARAAQWAYQQLLERAALPFAHQGHGGSNCGPNLQNDANHARHEKVRRAHGRVVKHLGPNIDRHSLPAGFTQKRFQ